MDCFSQSATWFKQLKKMVRRLLHAKPRIQQLLDNGAHRLLLHHARLCLMLGDHYYSSCPANTAWQVLWQCSANNRWTNVITSRKLDEHLVGVLNNALKISQTLSRFSSEMELAYDIKALKQKSPSGYACRIKPLKTSSDSRFNTKLARNRLWLVYRKHGQHRLR